MDPRQYLGTCAPTHPPLPEPYININLLSVDRCQVKRGVGV